MNSMVIEVMNLVYSYGKNPVLRGISFNVPKNSIAGLIGPNGSGKTTTLFIILGLLRPKRGVVRIFGSELSYIKTDIKRKIGFVFEQPSFYNHLTMRQNLVLIGKLYGMSSSDIEKKIDFLSRKLHLDRYLDSKPNKLSHGYRQRFAIAEALLPDPELLILDEPTTGIDPETMIIMYKFISELNAKDGMTVLMSSHNLYLLEKTANYFIFIKDGKILAEGWRDELLSSSVAYENQYVIEVTSLPKQIREELSHQFNVIKWQTDTKFLLETDSRNLTILIRFLQENGIFIRNIKISGGDLEELYLRLCSDEHE